MKLIGNQNKIMSFLKKWYIPLLLIGIYLSVFVVNSFNTISVLLISIVNAIFGGRFDSVVWLERLSTSWIWSHMLPVHILALLVLIHVIVGTVKADRMIISEYLLLFGAAVVSWYMTEWSCHYDVAYDTGVIEPQYIILNIITVCIIPFLLLFITGSVKVSGIATLVIFWIVSVANYYTILLHGNALGFDDIYNFSTGMNVVKNYGLSFDIKVFLITVMYIICIVAYVLYAKASMERTALLPLGRRLIGGIVVVVLFAVLCILYVSPLAIKPRRAAGLTWAEDYHKYGFAAMAVETLLDLNYRIEKPSEYDTRCMERLAEYKYDVVDNKKPDIIIILNESFYDLTQTIDVSTDKEYMHSYNSLKNESIYGNAVTNGGTNWTEYSYLTSNSLKLIPNVLPFGVLDMNGANSIVSIMNEQGYTTLAAHPEDGANYYRSTAYPGMGFDSIHFKSDFKNLKYYGDRWQSLDKSAYENLIDWYNDMDEDAPRFMYLLTMQNHGDYECNDESYDLVHINEDFGEYTDDINEYLTSIYLSDEAFGDFVEYFRGVDRDVIICMVGDHAPAMINSLEKKAGTEEEVAIHDNSNPFIIWTNHEQKSSDWGNISVIQLVPRMLKAYNIGTSDYYRYISDISEKYPLVGNNLYTDYNGTIHRYDTTQMPSELREYFSLEYNNLTDESDNQIFHVN